LNTHAAEVNTHEKQLKNSRKTGLITGLTDHTVIRFV
jgi:hypothetical protein